MPIYKPSNAFTILRIRTSTANKLQEVCSNGIYALINNAGIMAMPDEPTVDGFDTQMQTNHLSHFLLTRELYPVLEKGAEIMARLESSIIPALPVNPYGNSRRNI